MSELCWRGNGTAWPGSTVLDFADPDGHLWKITTAA
jgi:hypothetical protein